MSWTLPCDVLCLGLANGGGNISRSLKLLCLKRNIGNLSAIQEKSGYLLRQRGNERFVRKPEVIQKRGSRKRVKRCGQVLGNSEIVASTDESVREVAVFLLNSC